MKAAWLEDNKYLLVIAGIVALLVYGVELGSFTLSIDEEVAAYEPASWRVWLSQGRWGMALLLKLLPNFTYIPFLATLIFCALLSTSAVYFARQFFADKKEAAVFSILFIASPIWLHVAEFNTLSWGVGIGLAATAAAVAFFRQHKFGSTLLACLLVGFATAIYQAFAIFFASLLLMLLLKDWQDSASLDRPSTSIKTMLLELARVAAVIAFALAIYLAMQKLLLYFIPTPIAYVDSFIHVDDYRQRPLETLAIAGHKIYGLVSGADPGYLGWGWAILILPWLGCIYCLRFAASTLGKPVLFVMHSLTAILIVLCVFSLVLLAAGSIPLRAIIGFPLLYALLGALGFRLLDKWPVVRIAVLAYSTLVCIWMSAFLFGLDSLARQRDEVMATRISAEITRIAPAGSRMVPVVFVGEWVHEPVQGVTTVEIFGTSFFQQDGGNPYRIAMFMRMTGTTNIEPRTVSAIKPYRSQVDSMPSWPMTGSVAKVNDLVVVKLGALSYQQKTELGL